MVPRSAEEEEPVVKYLWDLALHFTAHKAWPDIEAFMSDPVLMTNEFHTSELDIRGFFNES